MILGRFAGAAALSEVMLKNGAAAPAAAAYERLSWVWMHW